MGFISLYLGFNALKWDNKIEPLKHKEADRQYIIAIEEINTRAASAYFDCLLADVNLNIAHTNQEVNQKLVEIAQERYELGKISRNELLQLELELKSATKSVSAAGYQLEFAKASLYTLLGQRVPDSITLISPAPLDHGALISTTAALAYAREHRPEIIAYNRLKTEADRDINKAKVDYGIKANVFASFGFARGSERFKDIYADANTEQQVQLSVSIPLVDWGKKESAVGIASAQRKLIHQQIAQDEISFDNEIIQKILLWEQLQTELNIQKEIRALSLDRFEISRQRYVLGDISITDLTIAQREKDQAQRDYIASLRSYWVTYYELRMLTGYDLVKNETIIY